MLRFLSFALLVYASFANKALEQLKEELHKLTPDEAKKRFGDLKPLREAPPRQKKIDHFVVLYMENHAFDNYFGCMDLPGADGIPKSGRLLPKDPEDPSQGYVNVTCGTSYGYVCPGGPGYDTFAGKFKNSADAHTYPYGPQDDKYSHQHGADGIAIEMFSAEQLPVKKAIAENFGIFNKLYTAVPSASTPNHLFTQSATSCGIHDNIMYSECGGKTDTFPQFTIYDSLKLNGVDFAFYMNSTCGVQTAPCHGVNPHTPDAGSPIPSPDVAMAGVARHKDRFLSQEIFYAAAANGTLPQFSWLMPPFQACDHPCYDVAKGERLLKDIYEALRAGPGWNNTLFFVVYDDAGGYYDHIVPPSEGVPNDEAPCHVLDKCASSFAKFDFRRLGLRTSAMLISPWVARGTVFQEPKKGPYNTSQFELTSVPATVKNLFNLTGFLTKRDAWAGSFDELLLDVPRTDAPMHLPDAPAPAKPWDPPPGGIFGRKGDDADFFDLAENDDGEDEMPLDDDEVVDDGARRRLGTKVKVANPPQHCGQKEKICRGPEAVSVKQRRNIKLFSRLTKKAEPNVDDMTNNEADRWLSECWEDWMAQGGPIT